MKSFFFILCDAFAIKLKQINDFFDSGISPFNYFTSTIMNDYIGTCDLVTTLENVFVSKEDPLPIVLTRYLYIKEEVLVSLIMAILDKDCDQSIFWTCELYHSGFQKEIADYLLAVYFDMFQVHNPRMQTFMENLHLRYEEGPHIVATMARNLADPTRKFDRRGFWNEIPIDDTNASDPKFYISISLADISKYDTVEVSKLNSKISARTVLKTVCKYATRKDAIELFGCSHADISHSELTQMHLYNWIYYASRSPIWIERIKRYGGIINDAKQCVEFEEPEDEEEFYEYYGYDPDEQSVETQTMFLHRKEYVQMTKEQF